MFAFVYLVAPQPAGMAILFGLVAAQLLFGTILTWVRTKLFLATAAMGFSAIWSAAFAILWWIDHRPFSWPFIFLYATAILPTLMLGTESRIHPVEWAIWRRRSESVAMWEMLIGRHIPDFRNL